MNHKGQIHLVDREELEPKNPEVDVCGALTAGLSSKQVLKPCPPHVNPRHQPTQEIK